ncbi:ABC-2 type transport system permease protein [Fontibacillus phaseoli]|uniref:Transport permease protein n=1 Tax=Fontibacillus phaseoli TaxID=1416533 RepID=A0A369BQ39_9BACL|nr:ABC transporter permease [Fontibacillus phaseoli]RCX22768.1 ABC-2 type transport system permease protein [Fontibacillus phaseoli]
MGKNIWWLVLSSLRKEFRKRGNILIYFGLPLAGVLISTFIYANAGQSVLRVGVVNGDGAETVAAETVRFISEMGQVKAENVTEEELATLLAAGKLDSGVVLEEGYSQSVLAGQPDHIVISSIKGAEVTAYLKALLYNYIDNMTALGRAAEGDPARYQELFEEYRNTVFKLQAETVNDKSVTKDMTYQSLGFLILFMMMSSVNLTELILKHREDRTFYRIISSPVSSRAYVISNIIVNMIVMLLQIIVTLFFLRYVFKLDPGIPITALAGLLGLFALASVGISLVIVAFSKNRGVSDSLQNLIVTPTCLLAGCFFPVEIMPVAVRRIADFMPQRWVLLAVEELQDGSGFGGIWLNLSTLFVFAIVFFLIAAYKFGHNNDTRKFI